MSIINDFEDFKKLMTKLNTKRVYLFIGNGPKNQYEDMNQVESCLGEVLTNLGLRDGKAWIAIFGGDTYNKMISDLGAVVNYIKKEFSPSLLAVQCWPEVDQYVDYIWKYREEIDGNGKTIYGGVVDNRPVGGTSIYLNEDFRITLTGVIDVDSQGHVGKQELEYAKFLGLKVITVKL